MTCRLNKMPKIYKMADNANLFAYGSLVLAAQGKGEIQLST